MKKFISIIALVALVLSLAVCGSGFAGEDEVVYWRFVPKEYHLERNCPFIENKQGVQSGTFEESGKIEVDICKICSGELPAHGDGEIVYWSSGDSMYHNDAACKWLDGELDGGSIAEAGQREPCSACVTGNSAAEDASTDKPERITFRDAEWGITQDEVIAIEGREPDREGDIDRSGNTFVEYKNETISGFDCDIKYHFRDGELVAGAYLIDTTNAPRTSAEYLDNYLAFNQALTELYGEPMSEQLSDDGLTIISVWASPNFDGSGIIHSHGKASLNYGIRDPNHEITYTSPKYFEKEAVEDNTITDHTGL